MGLSRTVSMGSWEFHFFQQPGALYVDVPDRGGMMDSVPRIPEQLEWAEAAFATLPALERVWPTSWKVPPEALPDLEALLRSHGATW